MVYSIRFKWTATRNLATTWQYQKLTAHLYLKGEHYLANLINKLHSAEKFYGGLFHAPEHRNTTCQKLYFSISRVGLNWIDYVHLCLYLFPAGSLDYSLSSRVAFSFPTGVLFLFSFIGNSSAIQIVGKNQNMKSAEIWWYILVILVMLIVWWCFWCFDLVILVMLIRYFLFRSVWPFESFETVLCKTSRYIALVSFSCMYF